MGSATQRWARAAALVLLCTGCSVGRTTTDDGTNGDPLAVCSKFADAYAVCQGKLGTPETETTERAAASRAALEAQASSAKNDAERAHLVEQCTQGLRQLRNVCP